MLIFYREFEISNFNEEFIKKLESRLTINNLNSWNFKKTSSIYNYKFEQEFLYYRFKILYEWFNKNNNNSKIFLELLENNISSLGLEKFLNANEKKYINLLKSNIFTKNRNIKTLIVDFRLDKGTNVYFHYDNINVFFKKNDQIKLLKSVNDIYLSNSKIFFTSFFNLVYIKLDDIIQIQKEEDTIKFKTETFEYIIKSYDIETIFISIIRLFKILKRDAIWE